ncbi:unnamed protein product [Oikopleura dioica]|uniref:Uncharacterized protein n=1 Tax=Oikopleura dioica TaxID=34765 RepID=E4WWK4_OIKDI|nr:unnamed protein product [Oikopleura dioica]
MSNSTHELSNPGLNRAFSFSAASTGMDDLMSFIKTCQKEAMNVFF